MLRRRPTPSDGLLDLPGYTDLSVIGNGSSGVVYRAYQPRLDRVVAIKVVLADLSGGDLLARWERECRATGRLSRHPYIVTVLDAGVSPAGRPYLVMDWYPQGSLAASLHARGPMPIAKVLTLGVKLCGALETAHRTGILHRDVKPENVLLDELGEPALADFGIAGIAGTATAQLGPRALTPVHAAPEVLDDRPASPASDVYALGSVLYTALAGRAAYEAGSGEGFAALLARILTQPLPPIGRADVPAALEEAVSWAMAKDPAARPASAAALGQRLQQIQVQLEEAPADLVITAPAGTGRGAGFPPDGAAPPRTTTPPNGAAHPTGAAPTNDAALPAGAAPPNGAAAPDDRIQIGGSTVERPARRDRDAPLPPLGSPAPTSSTPPPGAPTRSPPPPLSGPGNSGTVARPARSGRVAETPRESPPAPRRRWLWWIFAVAVGVGAAVIGVVVAGTIDRGPAQTPPTTLVVNEALAPTGLRVTSLGSSSVQLHWRDNAGGRYPFVVLYEPPLADGHASDAAGPGSTSYLVTGLRPNHRTCFRVALANGSDSRSWPVSSQVCTSP